MKRNIPLLLFLCALFQLNAQSQTANITGAIFDDATKESIELASIRILNAKDSTYVTGGVTASDGKFSIGVKQGNYIVHTSFLGYLDRYYNVNTRNKTALGNIYMKEDGITLKEAVVTAQAIEVKVMGDTVEYNADSYKVQESAVIEDLVKKLPGAEVDTDGKITVNGKEIKKILVDGKEFFSSDPKVASKNLPAQIVEKLQVLDRKSDMAQMTGFDDGDEETVINLTIKKGMKEGLYGSGTAGAGSKDRYGLSGIVNYMRNESQFTLLGGTNNTNNEGFTDNTGNSFRGMRGGGMNFGGRYGLSKSSSGGFNFAINPSNKLKWGGNIRYGDTGNDVQQSTFTQTYITDTLTGKSIDQYENRQNIGINKSNNFGGDFRFEWSPDAATKVIFSPNIQYGKNTNIQKSNYLTTLINPADTVNRGNSETYSDGTSKNLSGRLEVSRELGKKGRVLSFSLSGGYSDLENDGIIRSETTYRNQKTGIDSIGAKDQIYNQKNNSYNWRAYASYVEPIGNNNFLQLTYSFRKNHTENDRNTFRNDGSGNYTDIDPSATKKLENDFTNQEIRANFKAVREKYDYTIGLALQPSKMQSVTTTPKETEPTSNNVLNYAPIAQFNYRWSKQKNLRINYDGSTTQPSASQLSNITDNSNPLNIIIGNPDLKPSFSNRFRVQYRDFNPQQGSMVGLFGNLNFSLNDIVTRTETDNLGVRTNTYENINGNWNAFLRMMVNKPLSNRKLSIDSGTGGSYQQNNGYTNGDKNTASTFNISENLGLRYRSEFGAYGNEKRANNIDLLLRGNFGYSNTVNSLESLKDMNLNTFDYGGYFETTLQLHFGLTFGTDIRYTANSGYSNGYKVNEWLWNASISQQLFKAKNGTLKLTINDILKQREKIVSQPNVSSSYYVQSTYNTLPSYFMLSFSYRFQIFKGGAKQSDMDGGGRGGWRGRGPGGPMM
jgi:hypothetical protein